MPDPGLREHIPGRCKQLSRIKNSFNLLLDTAGSREIINYGRLPLNIRNLL